MLLQKHPFQCISYLKVCDSIDKKEMENQQLKSSLRGRQLIGNSIAVPLGSKGYKNARLKMPGVMLQKDVEVGSFDKMVHWHHDNQVGKDGVAQTLAWMEIVSDVRALKNHSRVSDARLLRVVRKERDFYF